MTPFTLSALTHLLGGGANGRVGLIAEGDPEGPFDDPLLVAGAVRTLAKGRLPARSVAGPFKYGRGTESAFKARNSAARFWPLFEEKES